MVALGDSLTVGMQDAITRADRQQGCYSALIAAAAGVPFNLPLITDGSIPPSFWAESAFDVKKVMAFREELVKKVGPLAAYLEYVGTPKDFSPIWAMSGMGRRDPATLDSPRRPQHNFALAGVELRHLNDVHGIDDYVREMRDFVEEKDGLLLEVPGIRNVLQNGTDTPRGSQVDQAIRANPDLVLLWGGGNDALAPAFAGVIDDRTLTPIIDKPWDFWHKDLLTSQWTRRQTDTPVKGFYSAMLGPQGSVTRLLRETQAEIMLMTVPDITAIPFLRRLGEPVGHVPFRVVLEDGTDATERIERYSMPLKVVGPGKEGRTEFPAGTSVGLINLLTRIVTAAPGGAIHTKADLESALKRLDEEGGFDEWEVLDPDEIARVNDRIDEFNQVIRFAARNPRVHVVDTYALMHQLRDDGRDLLGNGPAQRVTTTFTGSPTADGQDGIFSFDGVHPSFTGHAVLANAILDRIKQDLGNREKFRPFRDAHPVDEKAIFAHDPHRGNRPSMLLCAEALALMAPPREQLELLAKTMATPGLPSTASAASAASPPSTSPSAG